MPWWHSLQTKWFLVWFYCIGSQETFHHTLILQSAVSLFASLIYNYLCHHLSNASRQIVQFEKAVDICNISLSNLGTFLCLQASNTQSQLAGSDESISSDFVKQRFAPRWCLNAFTQVWPYCRVGRRRYVTGHLTIIWSEHLQSFLSEDYFPDHQQHLWALWQQTTQRRKRGFIRWFSSFYCFINKTISLSAFCFTLAFYREDLDEINN